VRAGDRLCAGFSGALDSTVLLHVLAALRETMDFRLRALHVHHGLNPRADDWAARCAAMCASLAVPLNIARVKVVAGGQGLEAAARAARYRAYADQDADFIVLGHQMDDQAETVLLNLLRGSGIAGLAAMPARRPAQDGPGVILRPFLGVNRSELQAYARRYGLDWVEDDSNDDVRLTRNRLRHHVMPVLAGEFPAYRQALCRAARHMADGASLLEDLARQDAGARLSRDGLDLAGLEHLSRPRWANLLRYCLEFWGLGQPSAAALGALLDQLPVQGRVVPADAASCWRLGSAALRLWRGRLHVTAWRDIPSTADLPWHGEGTLEFAGGIISFTPAAGQGLALARIRGRRASLGLRRGGERIRMEQRGPRRALKKVLAESAIPPWERGGLPLLFVDGELAWVAGVGLAAGFQATDLEPGLVIGWQPPSPRP